MASLCYLRIAGCFYRKNSTLDGVELHFKHDVAMRITSHGIMKRFVPKSGCLFDLNFGDRFLNQGQTIR